MRERAPVGRPAKTFVREVKDLNGFATIDSEQCISPRCGCILAELRCEKLPITRYLGVFGIPLRDLNGLPSVDRYFPYTRESYVGRVKEYPSRVGGYRDVCLGLAVC